MAGDGWRWLDMPRNLWKWPERAKDEQTWLHMAGIGW